MHVTDSAVQLLGMNPVIAAGAGYAARTGISTMLRTSPYAPLLGRLLAALIWGCGGMATLTAVGVAPSVTVPLALTVLTVVLLTLALAFAAGLLRPARTVAPASTAESARS
ncbi:hypothetical protein ACFO5K_15640 [Nocardia halotolerans]|uniref:Uncharacterized protein n=1 Tax=Nocardia halotolerans TaxID=1755878 RepID=A0ABV8VL65_9NOCA